MKLQAEKNSKAKDLEEQKWRLAHNQPPSEDAEREWYRLEAQALAKHEARLMGASDHDPAGVAPAVVQPCYLPVTWARPGSRESGFLSCVCASLCHSSSTQCVLLRLTFGTTLALRHRRFAPRPTLVPMPTSPTSWVSQSLMAASHPSSRRNSVAQCVISRRPSHPRSRYSLGLVSHHRPWLKGRNPTVLSSGSATASSAPATKIDD